MNWFDWVLVAYFAFSAYGNIILLGQGKKSTDAAAGMVLLDFLFIAGIVLVG